MLVVKMADSMDMVRELWTEYWTALGLPDDFQGFHAEIQTLPENYAPPKGALAVAHWNDALAGTVALRPLAGDACEVKRLYVRAPFRRQGVGRGLLQWMIEHARSLGYRTIHGDTLPSMAGAMRMYRELGFEISNRPYSENPTPGAIFLTLQL